MSWFKFSLVVLLMSSVHAQSFSSRECLHSKFSNHIKNEGQLFGLIKNDLKISKDVCQVEVNFKKILDTTWKIDLCREPIHMKVTSKGNQQVYKRNDGCDNASESEYCQYKNELLGIIQDYGLIYAQGERELLSTDHGQTFCVFLLLKEYLNNGVLFSKYEEPADIFKREGVKGDESCPLPADQKKESQYRPEASYGEGIEHIQKNKEQGNSEAIGNPVPAPNAIVPAPQADEGETEIAPEGEF